jgi:Uma2 family endonuclease
VLPSDLRVLVPATGLYTYPDVSVVCDKPAFADAKQDILLNPSVLIEVLSESTENYDRGKKFENYRSIATLTDYLLVAQDRVLVEHYRRQGDGGWLLHEIRDGMLTLPCGAVSLEEVYRRVLPAA